MFDCTFFICVPRVPSSKVRSVAGRHISVQHRCSLLAGRQQTLRWQQIRVSLMLADADYINTYIILLLSYM